MPASPPPREPGLYPLVKSWFSGENKTGETEYLFALTLKGNAPAPRKVLPADSGGQLNNQQD